MQTWKKTQNVCSRKILEWKMSAQKGPIFQIFGALGIKKSLLKPYFCVFIEFLTANFSKNRKIQSKKGLKKFLLHLDPESPKDLVFIAFLCDSFSKIAKNSKAEPSAQK